MKYYLHNTSAFQDEKITELFINFGYEGLGLFYTLLEKIAFQESPIKTNVLKSQLKVGKKLEKCWNFMEQIELISSNNGETFNEQLLKVNEKFIIKKEKNKIKIAEWREKQKVKKSVTSYEPECNSSTLHNNTLHNITEHKKDIVEINSTSILEPLIIPEKKDTKSPKKTNPLFQPLKKIYSEWYKKQFNLEPVFSAKEHIGINGIIKYFQINQYDYENTIDSWQIILNKYHEWDKFYQNSTTPSQINCNLSNIIIKLRNGKSGNSTQQRAEKFSDEKIAAAFAKFNS